MLRILTEVSFALAWRLRSLVWISAIDDALRRQRMFVWSVAIFAAGLTAYLRWPFEPSPMVTVVILAASVVVLWLLRATAVQSLVLCFLFPAILGFGYMQWHAHRIAAQAPPPSYAGVQDMEGTLEAWDARGKIHYLTLRLKNSDEEPIAHPFRVRLRVYDSQLPETAFNLGDTIAVFGKIAPPSPAKVEGGFSARRHFWFQNLHYSGFALGKVTLTRPYQARPLTDLNHIGKDISYRIFAWRLNIAHHIRTAIDDADAAEVAVALLTGLRGSISAERKNDMRYSGLAHLLAISGLHMGLAAFSVFFLVRLALVLYNPWALRLPTKKIAAAIAIATAFVYWLLSGQSVSAERAWIMVSIALFAMILDRRFFNMHTVAISAAILLIFKPQQITNVGFQLSFLAVVALTAYFEFSRNRKTYKNSSQSAIGKTLIIVSRPLRAAFMSTLVAGLATLPAVSHYFGYIAPWSLLSNLMAVPLTGLWIIPSGFIGLALLPFGLHDIAFAVMGEGVEILLDIAAYTRHLPAGEWRPMHFSGTALGVFAVGFLWLCLWHGKARLLGIVPILCAFLLWVSTDKPRMIIAGDSPIFAVALGDGSYGLYGGARHHYRTSLWREHYALGEFRKLTGEARWASGACDISGCRLGESFRIALAFDRNRLWRDCLRADFVVAYFEGGNFDLCRRRGVGFIDYRDLRSRSALLVYEDGMRYVLSPRGRLWER